MDAPITTLRATAYTVPTRTDGAPCPESDGTARWDSTTIVVVEVGSAGQTGLGYSYTSTGAIGVIRDILAPVVLGREVDATGKAFWAMARAVRNIGWCGVAASAVSAVDIALHDLKARLREVSLLDLLGVQRQGVLAYGSGGFTNYSTEQTSAQLSEWVQRGMHAVKMKVGRDAAADTARVRAARDVIGDDVRLFVDANGAYERAQARAQARRFTEEADVSWFEEPVSSDDLAGLRLVRDSAPRDMQVAAGEYVWTPAGFHTLIAADAVDVVQADATRCGGVTGFLHADAQCAAASMPLSAHTAPALHAVLGCIGSRVVHVESFHDHELIEAMLFDGVAPLVDGRFTPDESAFGLGLTVSGRGREYIVERWEGGDRVTPR